MLELVIFFYQKVREFNLGSPYDDQLLPLPLFWLRIASRKLVLVELGHYKDYVHLSPSQRAAMRAQMSFRYDQRYHCDLHGIMILNLGDKCSMSLIK